jgi:hypothetical protein
MTDRCPTTWPLDDPNPEDRALARTHYCTHPPNHPGPHRCACGHHPDPFELALAQAIAAKPSHLNEDTE